MNRAVATSIAGMAVAVAIGCAPDARITVASTRDRGPLEQAASIKGRDGGYSARVFGSSVWVYGDSVLSKDGVDKSSWRHNTYSWTVDEDPTDGITGFSERNDAVGAPVHLFAETTAEHDFNAAHANEPGKADSCKTKPCGARRILWPTVLVDDPDRKRALQFFVKIAGEPGEWNFESVGYGVSEWFDLKKPPVRKAHRPNTANPTCMFSADEPAFGSAAVVDGDDLYVYGCEGGFSKPCSLARVPLADATSRAKWRYWDGDGWSADIDDAESVMDAHTMATVHWNAHLGCFLAFYSEPLSNNVMVRHAPRPEGPWSEAIVAFKARASHDGAVAYSSLAHAEYQIDSGKTETVTYYRSTKPWHGEIRVVEVTLVSTK